MEVTVLKGPGGKVQELADQVIAERGVRHGQVVYLPADPHEHVPQVITAPMAAAETKRLEL